LRIREATPEDARAVAAVKVRAWRAAYGDVLPAGVLDALDARVEEVEWRAYLAALPPGDRLWLAVDDGVVLGFARTGVCSDDDLVGGGAGEVHGLYVEPGRIGTGIGRRLLEHALEDLAARGLEPAVLWQFVGNSRAEAFYERAGLRLDGARRRSSHGVDEVRRRLEAAGVGAVEKSC
jgi:GNAT superfamily N-acetyltransferase